MRFSTAGSNSARWMIGFAAALVIAITVLTGFRQETAPVKVPAPALDDSPTSAKGSQSVVLSGGCFWGIQAVFEHVKGVTSATAGYSGGSGATAQYETVSTGTTGHAESVKVTFDTSRVTLGQLLQVFFSVAHNPTELNRQGPDVGSQYRSAIFFENPRQQQIATAYVAQLDAAKVYPRPIVTQIVPYKAFYAAEDYHQDYAAHHPDQPYIYTYDLPKLAHLKQMWPALYK